MWACGPEGGQVGKGQRGEGGRRLWVRTGVPAPAEASPSPLMTMVLSWGTGQGSGAELALGSKPTQLPSYWLCNLGTVPNPCWHL